MEYKKPILKIEKFEFVGKICSDEEFLSFEVVDEGNDPIYDALDTAMMNVFNVDILP